MWLRAQSSITRRERAVAMKSVPLDQTQETQTKRATHNVLGLQVHHAQLRRGGSEGWGGGLLRECGGRPWVGVGSRELCRHPLPVQFPALLRWRLLIRLRCPLCCGVRCVVAMQCQCQLDKLQEKENGASARAEEWYSSADIPCHCRYTCYSALASGPRGSPPPFLREVATRRMRWLVTGHRHSSSSSSRSRSFFQQLIFPLNGHQQSGRARGCLSCWVRLVRHRH